MRASSQSAFRAAQERWEPVLREAGGAARSYGEQLFAVVDVLDSSAGLRRSLTDPTRSGEDKAALVTQLLGGKVDPAVVDLLSGLVRGRWSAESDLVDSITQLAVDSVLAAAQNAGRLTEVQDEVFRLERLLADQRELRRALANGEAPAEQRGALVDQLLAGKVATETHLLARRAATTLRWGSVTEALRDFGQLAAARQELLVATVSAAVPLNQEQIDRLTALLQKAYGRGVRLNVGVDPEVLGGLRVHVGDEVIDATVLARLEDARRRMAS